MFEYDLRPTVQQRAENYGFSVLASETVPDALVSALEAKSYEGAIRNAIAIGGDPDTIACMAGGIAETLFGMPRQLVQSALAKLSPEMQAVLGQLYSTANLPMPLRRASAPGSALCFAAIPALLKKLARYVELK